MLSSFAVWTSKTLQNLYKMLPEEAKTDQGLPRATQETGANGVWGDCACVKSSNSLKIDGFVAAGALFSESRLPDPVDKYK